MVAISLKHQEIARLCKQWKIKELALFGSVLRDDFRPDSDVDVLVTFAEKVSFSLFDHQRLKEDLEETFGRRIDLITRRGLDRSRNERRREVILESAERIYVS